MISATHNRFGLPPHVLMVCLGLTYALLMTAVLVFGIPQQWHEPASEFVHNGAIYPLPVVFLVTQATYLLSLSLLFLPNRESKSFAAGTALLTSALFLVYDVVVVLMTVFMVFSTKRWEVAFFLLSWLLIPAHLLVVLGSWRLLKRIDVNASWFAAGMVFVLVYASATAWCWTTLDHRFRATRDLAVKEARTAHDSVKAISWCAIQYKIEHPQEGYPPSLDPLNSGASCPLRWSLSSTPTYHLWYVPEKNVAGQVAHFSVQATLENELPPDFNIRLNDYASDDSGIVYALYQDAKPMKGITNGNDGDINVGSDIEDLFRCVQEFGRAQRFANNHLLGDGDYPANLAEMSQCWYLRDLTSEVKGNSIRQRAYLITYRPQKENSQPIRRFQIDARCEDYGRTCVRNLYADQDGKIRGTGENRAAGAQDPFSPKCEFMSGWCDDSSLTTR